MSLNSSLMDKYVKWTIKHIDAFEYVDQVIGCYLILSSLPLIWDSIPLGLALVYNVLTLVKKIKQIIKHFPLILSICVVHSFIIYIK